MTLLAYRFLVFRFRLISAALAFAGLAARADTVVTASAERLEGKSALTPAGIAIGGKTVALADLFSLTTGAVPKPPGVRLLLTSGAVLPIREVQGTANTRFRAISIDSAPLEFPLADLAAIVLKGGAELPSSPGALLSSGDVFSGTLIALDGNSATLTSPLFGRLNFPLKDLASIVLRPVVAGESPFTLRLRDGTVALANTVGLADNAVVFSLLPNLPPKTIGLGEILSVTHSASAAGRMGDQALSPSDGDGRGLELALPAGTAAFIARVRIDPELMPIARTRVVFLLDGTEVYRTAPLTSLDDPVLITLPTAGKSRLTVRLDSSVPIAARGSLQNIQLLAGRP